MYKTQKLDGLAVVTFLSSLDVFGRPREVDDDVQGLQTSPCGFLIVLA